MKPGPKKGSPQRGGRRKGIPNRATADAARLIEQTLGSHPLERMALLAGELLTGERRDEPRATEIAAKLLSQLAEYCSPKRKAIEVSGPGGGAVPIGSLTVEIISSNGE